MQSVATAIHPCLSRDPAAGIISQGTLVQVRLSLSGVLILDTTTDKDELCSNLVSRVAQECAATENVPRLCMQFQWKPPVPLRPSGFALMAYESAGQALPGVMRPLFLEATAVLSAIQDADHELKEAQALIDYCLVCLDPAEDMGPGEGW